MTKLRTLLLGSLLLIGLDACKTASKRAAASPTAAPTAPSSAAADAGLPSCSTQLALTNLGTPASVNSTTLTVSSPTLAVEHPVSGSSLAVLTIQAQADSRAQFIAYQACDTSDNTKCYSGRIVAPAGDAQSPDKLQGEDCRLASGTYQVTLRSCVEANLDSSTNFSAEGNGGDGHCGKPSSVTMNAPFPGNDSKLTRLCFKLADANTNLDKVMARARKKYKGMDISAIPEPARTNINNIANMGPILAYLVKSPARQAVQNAHKATHSQGMQLADTGGGCGVDVDKAIQTAAAAPSVAPDQAAQAAAVAAAAAANNAAPTPAPAAQQPPGSDFQYAQLWCTGTDRQTAGYVWSQVDGKFTGQTYTNPEDNTTWGCVAPGPSVVNPVALPNSPSVESGNSRNNLLVGGGATLLAVGAVIAIASGAAAVVNFAGKGDTFHARVRSLWGAKIPRISSFFSQVKEGGSSRASLGAAAASPEAALAERTRLAAAAARPTEVVGPERVVSSPRESLAPAAEADAARGVSDRTGRAPVDGSVPKTKTSKIAKAGPLLGVAVGAALITLGGVGLGKGLGLADSNSVANIISSVDADVQVALTQLDGVEAALLLTIGKVN